MGKKFDLQAGNEINVDPVPNIAHDILTRSGKSIGDHDRLRMLGALEDRVRAGYAVGGVVTRSQGDVVTMRGLDFNNQAYIIHGQQISFADWQSGAAAQAERDRIRRALQQDLRELWYRITDA